MSLGPGLLQCIDTSSSLLRSGVLQQQQICIDLELTAVGLYLHCSSDPAAEQSAACPRGIAETPRRPDLQVTEPTVTQRFCEDPRPRLHSSLSQVSVAVLSVQTRRVGAGETPYLKVDTQRALPRLQQRADQCGDRRQCGSSSLAGNQAMLMLRVIAVALALVSASALSDSICDNVGATWNTAAPRLTGEHTDAFTARSWHVADLIAASFELYTDTNPPSLTLGWTCRDFPLLQHVVFLRRQPEPRDPTGRRMCQLWQELWAASCRRFLPLHGLRAGSGGSVHLHAGRWSHTQHDW